MLNKNYNVLVTGSKGFIGKNLLKKLDNLQNINITIINNNKHIKINFSLLYLVIKWVFL